MIESIKMSIYQSIKKPIFSLAPMEDITDTVFRRIVSLAGRPDIFYTEFVNVEGLNSEGKEKIVHRLEYEISEKPIVAQLWGQEPENFLEAAKLVKLLGFDGIDINMGCSVKKVIKRNVGSGLMNLERNKVKEIVDSVKEGGKGLPISIKTRLGWDRYDIEGWIQFLLEQDIEVLTIHGRTVKGERSIKANWSKILKCVELRNRLKKNTLIFGNGDIKSLSQAKEYAKKYEVDGVMIGRAAITNPWIFSEKEDISQREKYSMLKKHIELFETVWKDKKNFSELKKFFKGYINNFEGADSIRQKLMSCNTPDEALKVIEEVSG